MNLEIREFQQNIINYINNYKLDIEIKRLVMKDIYHQIENNAELAIMKEIQEMQTQQSIQEMSESTENPEVFNTQETQTQLEE